MSCERCSATGNCVLFQRHFHVETRLPFRQKAWVLIILITVDGSLFGLI